MPDRQPNEFPGALVPMRRIYNKVKAAEYLGVSTTKLDELRKEYPFYEADRKDGRVGGFALWDYFHLELMADLLLGHIDEKMAAVAWQRYKVARYANIYDLCFSQTDACLMQRKRIIARKRQATRDRNEAGAEEVSA